MHPSPFDGGRNLAAVDPNAKMHCIAKDIFLVAEFGIQQMSPTQKTDVRFFINVARFLADRVIGQSFNMAIAKVTRRVAGNPITNNGNAA